MTPEQVERVADLLDYYAEQLEDVGGVVAQLQRLENRALAKAARNMLARYRAARKGVK